jgi:hypothetical protein
VTPGECSPVFVSHSGSDLSESILNLLGNGLNRELEYEGLYREIKSNFIEIVAQK